MTDEITFTAKKGYVPRRCHRCRHFDMYLGQAHGMTDDIVWLCHNGCGEWIDLAASYPNGEPRQPRPVDRRNKQSRPAPPGRETARTGSN